MAVYTESILEIVNIEQDFLVANEVFETVKTGSKRKSLKT